LNRYSPSNPDLRLLILRHTADAKVAEDRLNKAAYTTSEKWQAGVRYGQSR
jgi:hypothetical protein